MPRVWDGTWWFILLSVPPRVLATHKSLATAEERDAAARELEAAMRAMCHILYGGASLLKINRDFMDVEYSCAPIFGASLIARLPLAWGVDDWALSVWLTRAFPLLTVVIELAVPVLSVLVGPATGVATGLALHAGIAVTPSPNNAGSFSVTAALWYFSLSGRHRRRAERVVRAPRQPLATKPRCGAAWRSPPPPRLSQRDHDV